MKKKLIIIVSIVLCALVAGGIVFFSNTPKNVFTRSLAKSISGIIERDEFAPIVEVFNGGSIEIDYNSQDGLSANSKVYFNLEDQEVFVENLKVTQGENSISAEIYYNEDTIWVKNEEYLGGTYGLQMNNLAEQFKNSIFYHEKDSKYALDKETSEMVLEVLKNFDDSSKNMKNDILELEQKYIDKIAELIGKHGSFKSSEEEQRVVSLMIDEVAACEMARELLDFIIKDEELKEIVIKYVNSYISTSAPVAPDGMSGESIYQDVIDELKEMLEEVEDIKLEKFMVTLYVVTPKLSTNLLEFRVSIDVEGEQGDGEFKISFGDKGVEKTNEIIAYINGEKVLDYCVVEDTKDVLILEMNYYDKPEKIRCFKMELNKEAGTFNVVIGEDLLQISGGYQVDGKKYTLTPAKVVVQGDIINLEGLTITICTKEKFPKVKNDFTSIFEITEEKLQEIEEKFLEMME